MLKPKQMTKIVVVGTNDVLEKTIQTLHDLNIVHIIDYNEADPDFKIGKPLKKASKFSEYLVSLRSISNQLKLGTKEIEKKYKTKELQKQIDEQLSMLEMDISTRVNDLRDIESKLKEKSDLEKNLKPLSVLELPLDLYGRYETLSVFVGYCESDIKPKIEEITQKYEIFEAVFEKKKIYAVFVPVTYESDVTRTLQDIGFVDIQVPNLSGNAREHLTEISNSKTKLEKKVDEIKNELENIKKKYADFILASDEYLSIETQKAEAPLKFATSENAFITEGWIPVEEYPKLESELSKSTNGKAYLTKLDEPVDEKEVPIALDNPKIARPFELLINVFATPKYKEIDPTSIIFITFPLFYGLMLGDVGYGLVILGLSLYLKTKLKTYGWQTLFDILLYSAIVTIIFGFIFGEFFGLEMFGEHSDFGLHEIPLLVPRFEDVKILLLLTIGIGIVHIYLGLLIGFRNLANSHGILNAMFEKGSWMSILTGGILAIYVAMPSLMAGTPMETQNPIFILGVILFMIGLILLIKGEGVISIMEIPTLLSNVLSYTRLLAIGLSSAGIALAVNTLSDELFISQGGFLIIIGILILLIGHFINLLLGIIGPGLHSLRLQYVEFFTKFYEGGGKKYNPFGFIRRYTKEE